MNVERASMCWRGLVNPGASFLRTEAPGFTSPRQHIDALSTFMDALK